MKFLCDRCKTRYSIGDERVRGKILKIRCKNCANVITVREGMTPESDAPASAPAAAPAPAPAAPARSSMAAVPAAAAPAAAALVDRKAVTRDLGRPGREPATVSRAGAALEPATAASRSAPRDPAGTAAAAAASGARAAAAREPAPRPADSAAQPRRAVQADAARGPSGSAAARGDSVSALNAAFASAMASPAPPALEEEWYVSIDGEQAGPYSLADAQHWVTQQPFEAELHCWSEGFDDWLPVDKVSHFRGLRKRPTTPAAPPPLSRAGAAPRAVAAAPAPVEDEPKPLFAATMASLERGAPAMPIAGLGLPPPTAATAAAAATAPTAPARATPPLGSLIQPRGRNGAQGAPIADAAKPEAIVEPPIDARRDGMLGTRPGVRVDAKPGARIDAKSGGKPGEKPGAAIDAKPGARIDAKPGAAADARPAVHIDGRAAGAPVRSVAANPFDVSEGNDAATQLEAMPFDEPVEPRRSGLATGRELRPSASDAAVTAPHLPASSTLRGTGAHTATAGSVVTALPGDSAGDDLAFGEVSRVVNLTDVANRPRDLDRASDRAPDRAPDRVADRPRGRRSATPLPVRSTGGIPNLAAGDREPGASLAPMVRSHRRGLIALLVVAGVLLLGVVGALVLVATRDDDATGGSLGEVRDIDTSRPDDPVAHHPADPVGSAGSAAIAPVAPPAPPRTVPHRPPPTGSLPTLEAPPTGAPLASDEIEDVARKHVDTTQRCYLRSQRGADAILVGDVKKITVTLTIDRDGNVSDLQLSEHAADVLGKCLSTTIRGWKFRPSSGGTYRFSLNFVAS